MQKRKTIYAEFIKMAAAQVNLGSSTRHFRTRQKKCIRSVLKFHVAEKPPQAQSGLPLYLWNRCIVLCSHSKVTWTTLAILNCCQYVGHTNVQVYNKSPNPYQNSSFVASSRMFQTLTLTWEVIKQASATTSVPNNTITNKILHSRDLRQESTYENPRHLSSIASRPMSTSDCNRGFSPPWS